MRIACITIAIGLAVTVVEPSVPVSVASIHAAREERIDGVDAVVDDAGRIYVVFVVRTSASAPDRLEYVRLENAGGAWSKPIAFGAGAPGAPRMVLLHGRLHLFEGAMLHHWVLASDGREFARQPDLIAPGTERALAYDVAAVADSAVVAYVSGSIPARAYSTPLEVVAMRWSEAALTRTVIGTLSPSIFDQPAPSLAVNGTRVNLLAAINDSPTSHTGNAETTRPEAQVVGSASTDSGTTWSRMVTVVPSGRFSRISATALTNDGRQAFISALGLFRSTSPDTQHWSVPTPVAAYVVRFSSGSNESEAVAASRGVVAWIDGRFTRSDRRWWNPLGGFPWSDEDPLWANNDVFTLPVSEATDAARPARLTGDAMYATGVRLRPYHDGVLAVWAGRAGVGKVLAQATEPTAVFVAELDARGAVRRWLAR